MIVLIGGEKGGTGKTTLATNLAQMRAARGRDVLLVDTDKQESASAWASLRAEEGIEPTITAVQKLGKNITRDLLDLAKRYDDLSYNEFLAKNLKVADATSVSLARDNKLPMIFFDLGVPGNIARVVLGEKIGTTVHA